MIYGNENLITHSKWCSTWSNITDICIRKCVSGGFLEIRQNKKVAFLKLHSSSQLASVEQVFQKCTILNTREFWRFVFNRTSHRISSDEYILCFHRLCSGTKPASVLLFYSEVQTSVKWSRSFTVSLELPCVASMKQKHWKASKSSTFHSTWSIHQLISEILMSQMRESLRLCGSSRNVICTMDVFLDKDLYSCASIVCLFF